MHKYTNVQFGTIHFQFKDNAYDIGALPFSALFNNTEYDIDSFDELLASFITRRERVFVNCDYLATIGIIANPLNVDLSQLDYSSWQNLHQYDMYVYVVKDDANPNRMFIIYCEQELGNSKYKTKLV